MQKNYSPAELIDLKASLKYLLLVEGLSQLQAADILGLSRKTVSRWVNDPVEGYAEELRNYNFEHLKKEREARGKETLDWLEAKVRVNMPEKLPLIKEIIRELRKPILRTV